MARWVVGCSDVAPYRFKSAPSRCSARSSTCEQPCSGQGQAGHAAAVLPCNAALAAVCACCTSRPCRLWGPTLDVSAAARDCEAAGMRSAGTRATACTRMLAMHSVSAQVGRVGGEWGGEGQGPSLCSLGRGPLRRLPPPVSPPGGWSTRPIPRRTPPPSFDAKS